MDLFAFCVYIFNQFKTPPTALYRPKVFMDSVIIANNLFNSAYIVYPMLHVVSDLPKLLFPSHWELSKGKEL